MRRGIDTDEIESTQIDEVRWYPADPHNLVKLDDRITLSKLALNLAKWITSARARRSWPSPMRAQVNAQNPLCISVRHRTPPSVHKLPSPSQRFNTKR